MSGMTSEKHLVLNQKSVYFLLHNTSFITSSKKTGKRDVVERTGSSLAVVFLNELGRRELIRFPGSRQSIQGYIMAYPRRKRRHLRQIVSRGDRNFRVSGILSCYIWTSASWICHITFRASSSSSSSSSSNVALRPQRPRGLLGTGSPGRPPRLSHSSWALERGAQTTADYNIKLFFFFFFFIRILFVWWWWWWWWCVCVCVGVGGGGGNHKADPHRPPSFIGSSPRNPTCPLTHMVSKASAAST